MKINRLGITLASLLVFAPLFATAQTAPVTYGAGVESCGPGVGGALSGSIGSYTPIGGPYVPVVDSAVELNTATLVYKQCVLDRLVAKQREAATAGVVRYVIDRFASQHNGGPMFPVYYDGEKVARQDASLTRSLQDPTLNSLNPRFRNLVKGAIALNYSVGTRAYDNTVACPYEGDINEMMTGSTFTFSGFLDMTDPRCDPLFAYYRSQDIVRRNMALDQEEMMYRLMTGDGVYGVEGLDADGNRITLLPGTFVRGNVQNALLSGFNQLQSARSVGEITNALFATMGAQAMTSGNGRPSNSLNSGLFNLTNAGAGSLNTLDRIIEQGLNNLFGGGGGASSTEQAYYNVAVDIRNNLLQPTAAGIQTAEGKCWTGTTHSESFINTTQLPEIASSTLGSLIASVEVQIASSTQALQSGQQVHSQQDLTTIQQLRTALSAVMPEQIIQKAVDLWKTMTGVKSTCSI